VRSGPVVGYSDASASAIHLNVSWPNSKMCQFRDRSRISHQSGTDIRRRAFRLLPVSFYLAVFIRFGTAPLAADCRFNISPNRRRCSGVICFTALASCLRCFGVILFNVSTRRLSSAAARSGCGLTGIAAVFLGGGTCTEALPPIANWASSGGQIAINKAREAATLAMDRETWRRADAAVIFCREARQLPCNCPTFSSS